MSLDSWEFTCFLKSDDTLQMFQHILGILNWGFPSPNDDLDLGKIGMKNRTIV